MLLQHANSLREFPKYMFAKLHGVSIYNSGNRHNCMVVVSTHSGRSCPKYREERKALKYCA